MNSQIKKGLGRGLSSLIGETKVEVKTNKLSLSDEILSVGISLVVVIQISIVLNERFRLMI